MYSTLCLRHVFQQFISGSLAQDTASSRNRLCLSGQEILIISFQAKLEILLMCVFVCVCTRACMRGFLEIFKTNKCLYVLIFYQQASIDCILITASHQQAIQYFEGSNMAAKPLRFPELIISMRPVAIKHDWQTTVCGQR